MIFYSIMTLMTVITVMVHYYCSIYIIVVYCSIYIIVIVHFNILDMLSMDNRSSYVAIVMYIHLLCQVAIGNHYVWLINGTYLQE